VPDWHRTVEPGSTVRCQSGTTPLRGPGPPPTTLIDPRRGLLHMPGPVGEPFQARPSGADVARRLSVGPLPPPRSTPEGVSYTRPLPRPSRQPDIAFGACQVPGLAGRRLGDSNRRRSGPAHRSAAAQVERLGGWVGRPTPMQRLTCDVTLQPAQTVLG